MALICGATVAVLIALLTSLNKPPRFQWLFAYLGFGASVIWIYMIANEIVNILTVIICFLLLHNILFLMKVALSFNFFQIKAFGVILNLSNTILGLTFLAWGNSLPGMIWSHYISPGKTFI